MGEKWSNYSTNFEYARYSKIGNIVFLEGLVKRENLEDTSISQTIIGYLKEGYRPKNVHIGTGWACYYKVGNSQQFLEPVRVDVLSDGRVVLMNFSGIEIRSVPYLSLNRYFI